MSDYGKGSITLERGQYRVRMPNGRGGHVTIGYYDTLDLAEEMRQTAVLARAQIGDSPTLRAFGEVWLARNIDQRNARTWAATWEGIVMAAPFADAPIDTITTAEVDRWTRSLKKHRARRSVVREGGERETVELDRPISRQTAQHALGLLKRCLDAALRDQHIKTNPADGASVPKAAAKGAAAGEPVTYLSAEDVERLLRCDVLPFEQRVVFTVAIFQGLREGELAALRWERIDWAEHGWLIAASWDGPTKNGKARWQTLLPRVELELRAWWSELGQPARGYVFPAHRGRAPVPKGGRGAQYAKGFDWGWADHPAKKLTRLGWWRRAGIRTAVRFHDLRDTCATHLLSGSWGARWELIDVSRFIGHSDPRVTAQRYAHLTRDAQRRAALALLTGPQTPAELMPTVSAKNVALPGRLELPTRGLGSGSAHAESPPKPASDARMRQMFGSLAREIDALTLAGADVPESLVQDAARAYLATKGNELAMAALAGGPMALQRMLELIALEGVDAIGRAIGDRP